MPTIRFFAAAAAAAGTSSEVRDAATLGDLRRDLIEAHGEDFSRVLDRCTILIDGIRSDDAALALAPGATVDVLPPFAGG